MKKMQRNISGSARYTCVQNQTYSVASARAVTGSILCGNRELAIIGHNKAVLNIVRFRKDFHIESPKILTLLIGNLNKILKNVYAL